MCRLSVLVYSFTNNNPEGRIRFRSVQGTDPLFSRWQPATSKPNARLSKHVKRLVIPLGFSAAQSFTRTTPTRFLAAIYGFWSCQRFQDSPLFTYLGGSLKRTFQLSDDSSQRHLSKFSILLPRNRIICKIYLIPSSRQGYAPSGIHL
jgi:hypothetical protein